MTAPTVAIRSGAAQAPAFGWLWHLAGVALMLVAGSLAAWGRWQFWTFEEGQHLVGLAVAAYLLSLWTTPRLVRFPGARVEVIVFAVLALSFLGIIAVVSGLRIYYSRSFLPVAFAVALIWQIAVMRLTASRHRAFAVVPGGMANHLDEIQGPSWQHLDRPDAFPTMATAVVADLHAVQGEEWLRFLAGCSLRGIPVYHAAAAYEAMTGRISVRHHSQADLEGFSKRPIYDEVKMLLELALVAATLPLWLPVSLCVAAAIRLESKGPVLFWQTRVGQGGKPFRMVKFRSMRPTAEDAGPAFAAAGDDRVTRVGRFIRQYRFDELPQLWNVLRGEMSLIGPRPEQVGFVSSFERELPLYALRHLVRPGITGWAQVNQGYAANTDETRIKLEHDLYYVKHLSCWLDMLIVFRTLRTMATGFGSR